MTDKGKQLKSMGQRRQWSQQEKKLTNFTNAFLCDVSYKQNMASVSSFSHHVLRCYATAKSRTSICAGFGVSNHVVFLFP